MSRRTLLRGAGVVMALPWLESLESLQAMTPADVFPRRFAVLFMGNGVNENYWGSEGSGAAMKLSETLEPLEPLKHKINVIHGLFHKRAMGNGIHPAQTGGLLCINAMPEGQYDTYFLKIDNCKFKQKVVPGDTMLLKMELIEPIRRGICVMRGSVFVGNKLCTEADLTAQLVKRN